MPVQIYRVKAGKKIYTAPLTKEGIATFRSATKQVDKIKTHIESHFIEDAHEPYNVLCTLAEYSTVNRKTGATFVRQNVMGFDIDKIMAFIEDKKINQLYVIGGDGTHRGAFLVHEACMAKVGKKYCIIHTGKQKQNSFPLFFFSSSWFNRRVSMFQWQVYQKQ